MNNSKMKKFINRVWLGIHKGWTTPNLPEHIIKLQSRVYIRIFRVIGGISTLSLLGRGFFELNVYGLYLALVLTFMFFIYNLFIAYHKFKHLCKIIKRGDLEIRNSPLDRLATRIASLVACSKGVCEYVLLIGGALGLMLGMDQILRVRESNRDAFFLPLIGRGINKVDSNNTEVQTWSDSFKNHIKTAEEQGKDSEVLSKLDQNQIRSKSYLQMGKLGKIFGLLKIVKRNTDPTSVFNSKGQEVLSLDSDKINNVLKKSEFLNDAANELKPSIGQDKFNTAEDLGVYV